MRKSLETFLAIAGAVVWIGAMPVALAAFGAGKASCSPARTISQKVREWPNDTRAAKHTLEAGAEADLNALEIHRHKLAACEKSGDELNLRLLPRWAFINQCMRRS
jgi:hypothetical protein